MTGDASQAGLLLIHQLSSERDFDALSTLVQDVETRFRHVAGGRLRNGDLLGHELQAPHLRCAFIPEETHRDVEGLANAPASSCGLLKRVYVVAGLKEGDGREFEQVESRLDQFRIGDDDLGTALELIGDPVLTFLGGDACAKNRCLYTDCIEEIFKPDRRVARAGIGRIHQSAPAVQQFTADETQ